MAQESKLEKAVTAYARSKKCYVRKFKAPGNRGVPDKLFLAPSGVVFFIEFKAPGKLPTALQMREINMIQTNKGNACVIDNLEQGKVTIDHYLSL